MGAARSSTQTVPSKHFHLAGDFCPYCEQPIPNDKVQEIRTRFEAKEREQAEALKKQLETAARAEIDKVRMEAAATLEKVRAEATAQHAEAREAGRKEAEASSQQKIKELEQAKSALETSAAERLAEAQQAKLEADERFEVLKTSYDTQVNQRVEEARNALTKDKTDAINTIKAQHFEETQKLTDKLEDFKRQLEKKTSDELGEGAEVKLFEALKEEFSQDRIERIGRGKEGADIKHVVMHNGRECGTIVYDSKDRRAWRNDYVAKLAKDQRAAKAEYAILSTLKFPRDTRQLHLEDGVIIANPARVVALVHMIRSHVVHLNSLRLSNTERAKKTAKLYEFITSKRCVQLLNSIDSHAEDLLELQRKEIKTHETTWKQQGTLLRSIQKVRADLQLEIDRIVEEE